MEKDTAPAVKPAKDTDAIIEAWFRDHFAGGASIVRDATDWNYLMAAKADLKQRLA